jgi:hypothetical protein
MTDLEYEELRKKMTKADKLKCSISNISDVLNKIEDGDCVNFSVRYEDGGGGHTSQVNADTLKVNSDFFNSFFTLHAIEALKQMKDNLEKEYAEL